MEVTVQIPDTIRERLGKDRDELPRWLLEKAGLEAYRSREISGSELRLLLGITNPIGLHRHVVVAFLTSRIPTDLLETDIILPSPGGC